MKFPIDTRNLKFGSGGKPVPVIDFISKLPKTDESGVPLFKVPFVVITDEGPEIFDVRVVGSLWRGARAAESDSLLIGESVLLHVGVDRKTAQTWHSTGPCRSKVKKLGTKLGTAPKAKSTDVNSFSVSLITAHT